MFLLRVLLTAGMVSRMFRRPVSSAKGNVEKNLIKLCKSFMYKRKSKGARTGPCGTQKLTLSGFGKIPSIKNVLHPVWEIGFTQSYPFILSHNVTALLTRSYDQLCQMLS